LHGNCALRSALEHARKLKLRANTLRFSASDSPIQVQVIDTDEKIQTLLPVLDKVVSEGVIAMSDIDTHQDGKGAKQTRQA
jgi:PII-like signaling protein